MSAGAVPGMLEWMPRSSGAACSPIACVTAAPQSPPCATNRVYPSRFISTTQARAMRVGSQPVVVGLAENPWPGSEGITRWNASAALAPCAVGLVSGAMIFSCSRIEPGQPCVRRGGVDEVNVQPVDLGHEVRLVIQFRFAVAPVVAGRPVAREVLHRREPDALRVVGDRLAFRPPSRDHPPAQLGELLLSETDPKSPNSGLVAARLLYVLRHARAPSSCGPGISRVGHDAGVPPAPRAHRRRAVRVSEYPWLLHRRRCISPCRYRVVARQGEVACIDRDGCAGDL